MRIIKSNLKNSVARNNKKIYNKPANNAADKRVHGYKVSAQALRLMHYRFIEKNLDAVMEAAEEQKQLREKRSEQYKKDITCECGAWKARPFKLCKNCYMKTHNVVHP